MVANQPGDSCDSSDAGHTNLHREPEVEVPSSAHQPPLDRAVAAHFSEVTSWHLVYITRPSLAVFEACWFAVERDGHLSGLIAERRPG